MRAKGAWLVRAEVRRCLDLFARRRDQLTAAVLLRQAVLALEWLRRFTDGSVQDLLCIAVLIEAITAQGLIWQASNRGVYATLRKSH